MEMAPRKLTNESGNVVPGDLLVSASKPGYAMKNNNLLYSVSFIFVALS